MRIVLSRKGFDSSAGGCPSPILPGGSLLALPIPDAGSPVRYRDISCDGLDLGALVADLTQGRLGPDHGAHLDPDLQCDAVPRPPDWRPLFGQTGAAQGHLQNQGVVAGDLFLFFGLFQPVVPTGNGWRFDRSRRSCHALWGWLQVDAVHRVDTLAGDDLPWSASHPHRHRGDDPANTLYQAGERLVLPGTATQAGGAGLFPAFAEPLQLTDPDASRPTQWRLPAWFAPREGRRPLSYHSRQWRWREGGDYVALQAVARGQEFVLDTADYPEALTWVADLIADWGRSTAW